MKRLAGIAALALVAVAGFALAGVRPASGHHTYPTTTETTTTETTTQPSTTTETTTETTTPCPDCGPGQQTVPPPPFERCPPGMTPTAGKDGAPGNDECEFPPETPTDTVKRPPPGETTTTEPPATETETTATETTSEPETTSSVPTPPPPAPEPPKPPKHHVPKPPPVCPPGEATTSPCSVQGMG